MIKIKQFEQYRVSRLREHYNNDGDFTLARIPVADYDTKKEAERALLNRLIARKSRKIVEDYVIEKVYVSFV